MTPIDSSIIVGFLIITFVVGVAIDRKKSKSVTDYAVARGFFRTPALLFGMLATLIGANSIVGSVEDIHDFGIISYMSMFCVGVSTLILGKFIVPKINNRFKGMISTTDMSQFFYKDPRYNTLVSWAGFLMCAIFVVAQFVAMGYILKIFLGVSFEHGVFISASIITLYATVGGIKSVVFTDVLQFSVITVVLPFIIVVVLGDIPDINIVYEAIPQSYFEIFDSAHFWEYFAFFLSYCIPVALVAPIVMQRYLMSNDVRKNQFITYVFGVVAILIATSAYIIASVGFYIAPSATGKEIIPTIIQDILPVGIKGIAACTIIAAIMSTADSCLNTAGVILGHNILGGKNQLLKMKVATFLTGVFAAGVALKDYNLVRLLATADAISAIFIGLPLAFGLLGLRLSMRQLWRVVIALSATFVLLHIIGISELIICCVIVYSGIAMYVSCYLFNHPLKLSISQIAISPFLFLWKRAVLFLRSVRTKFYSMQNSVYERSIYEIHKNLFIILMFGSLFFPYVLWQYSDIINDTMVAGLRMFAGFLCIALFLIQDHQHSKRNFYKYYWHFTVTYCLSFLSILIYLLNHNSPHWLINAVLSISLLSILTSWLKFAFSLCVGGVCAALCCYFLVGFDHFEVKQDILKLAGYAISFFMLINILFIRKRDSDYKNKTEGAQLLGGVIAHEMREPLTSINHTIELIKNEKVSREQALERVIDIGKLSSTTLDMITLLLMQIHSLNNPCDQRENMEKVSANKLVRNAVSEYPFVSFDPSNLVVECHSDFLLFCNAQEMKYVLFNLLKNSITHLVKQKNPMIKLTISSNDGGHNTISCHDNGCGIDQETQKHIFAPFFTGKKRQGYGIGLAFAKNVVEQNNGWINCDSKTDEFTEFKLIFSS